MNEKVRIAMLGSGFVANFYMLGLKDVPGQEVVVNYSKTEGHAKEFAKNGAYQNGRVIWIP